MAEIVESGCVCYVLTLSNFLFDSGVGETESWKSELRHEIEGRNYQKLDRCICHRQLASQERNQRYYSGSAGTECLN